MPLTDARIRNAKPKAKRYRLTDGNGLSLEVSPSGGKYWRYRYRLGNKENLFAAGEWCQRPIGEQPEEAAKRRAAGELTLSEARIEREKWRALVANGSHPVLAKRAERLVAAVSNANGFMPSRPSSSRSGAPSGATFTDGASSRRWSETSLPT